MHRWIVNLRGVGLAACLAAVVWGSASLPALAVELAAQGWSEADRNWTYNAPQGSRMIPWDWFLALEQPHGQELFRELDYLVGFQYLRPQNADENPWGLPIGFVRDANAAGVAYLGLTCLACHTRELQSGEQTLRIDGAPADASFFDFANALRQALERTLHEPAKFARFARRVLGGAYAPEKATSLRSEVQDFTNRFSALLARSRSPVPYGYGRLDAFGILLNEIVGTGLGLPENYRPAAAPVSYPHLWGAPDHTWVQWNGASEDPLARNIGEVLGVFGELRVTAMATQTSANLENLHALEEHIKRIQSPPWPSAWRAIDRAQAARGQRHYEQHCQSCHATPPPPKLPPNAYGRQLVDVRLVPVSELHTDPQAAQSFLVRRAKTGPLESELGAQDELPVALVLAAAVRRVMLTEFFRLGLTPAEQLDYRDQREFASGLPAHLQSPFYKARSLEGIWATSPYLHNGSVPTLYDLLLPAKDRPEVFKVGSRVFDAERVGLRTDQGLETFDTKQSGNANSGHEYGAGLTVVEREELLEYLKTL
ncbi:MAG: cytochrome c [Pirellulales bacterium]